MKKPFLILVILLLVSMISMVWMSPVSSVDSTELSVSPLNTIDYTLQPKPVQRINATDDGTFTDWTNNTLTVRPNAPEGTYSDWSGRILTLSPNAQGTYSDWSSWLNLIPNGDGNYTGWAGYYSAWDDWPSQDYPTDAAVSTNLNNRNETSDLTDPPATPRTLPISKVRLTMLAKNSTDSLENIQMILSTAIFANVSSFTEASGWTGWQRTGSTPWLNRADYPTNYINTSASASPSNRIGNFTFDDVPSTTGIGWSALQLHIRTWASGSVGGSDTLKIYLFDGTSWSSAYTVTPLTSVGSYRDVDVSLFLNSVAKINAAKMAIEKVTVGTADNIFVDYACIRLSGVRNSASLGAMPRVTTTYAYYKSEWLTNPFTGLAWTWADIDLLQAGVRSVMVGGSFTGYFYVTQLYVSVLTGGLYTDWDEWPDHTEEVGGSTDYVFATASAKPQSSALEDHTTENWNINKVRVSIVARANVTTDETVQICLAGLRPSTIQANVNGFTQAGGWGGWTRIPTGGTPWLSAADYPSNYIYSSSGTSDKIGDFYFADVASGITWSAVKLRIKTWKSSGGDDTLTIDLSNNGGGSWGWTYTFTPTNATAPGDYKEVDVSSYLVSVSDINNAAMRLTRSKQGTAVDTVGVDHAYLFLSGVMEGGSTVTPGTTYTEYTSEWATNPATSSSWTWSDIDALQAGVMSKAVGSWGTVEIRVSQLFVKVMEAGTYQHWDEATQDGDATYNSAVSGGLSRSSQLQDHTSETWPIARVQVNVVARADMDIFPIDTERERIRIMLVIGGIRYYSPDMIISYYNPLTQTETATQYSTYSYVWTTNPAWVPGWNWSAIDALQAGVNSVQVGTAWKGEIRVTQLDVVVGRAGTYDDWDDTTPDEDTYVSATMKDMQESSVLNITSPTPSWDIARVRVVFYARVTETTDEKVAPIVVIGGSPYAGTAYTPTTSTSYAKYTGDWGKNPVTGDYWTWSDIDSLEAGVMSLMGFDGIWVGEIRVTQLYVEVAGPRFMVYVQVTSVTDLYGFEFFLNYSTDVLTAASISSGGWFPLDSMEYLNIINDDLGYIRYSVTMPLGSPSGMTGSGKLANITFFPDSYGSSVLDLWNTKLRDRYATPISHVIEDGYFNNKIIGDVDANRKVDGFDLFDVGKAYDTAPSQPNWNIECDFNRDDKVNATDLSDLSTNYGTSV